MLKSGCVFIGKPTVHLHELLCVAMLLGAPIALSDELSYQIAKKFSEIIPVIKLSPDLSFSFFASGIEQLFTNLQPQEITPFFSYNPKKEKLLIYHLIEDGQKQTSKQSFKIFCSSFSHTQAQTPFHCDFVNLGAVGFLCYQKHKKSLQNIALSFFPNRDEAHFYMTQIIDQCPQPLLNKENTLDQIQFLNVCFEQDEPLLNNIVFAHGLIDAFIDLTKGCIFYDKRLSVLTTHHIKPFFSHQHISGFYQDTSPLVSLIPQDPQFLTSVVERYFDFETMDREEIMQKVNKKFFHKPLFSS